MIFTVLPALHYDLRSVDVCLRVHLLLHHLHSLETPPLGTDSGSPYPFHPCLTRHLICPTIAYFQKPLLLTLLHALRIFPFGVDEIYLALSTFPSLYLFFSAPTDLLKHSLLAKCRESISNQRTEHSPNKDKTRHYHPETPQSCSFQMPRPQGKNTNRSSQDKMPPPEASNPVTASPERYKKTRAQGEDSKIAILNMFINLKRIRMNHLVMTEKT